MTNTRPWNNSRRQHETREAVSRQGWKRPGPLPDIKARPGYKMRWVRVGTQGTADDRNFLSRKHEGYIPVRREDYPELDVAGYDGEANAHRRKGHFETGGLVLCEVPDSIISERDQYYQGIAQGEVSRVESMYKNSADPRLPTYNESRSQTQFGRGS